MHRVVRWEMRGFDAADSEWTVRPESPTSPNVEVTVESSLHFLLVLEKHLSMTFSVFWACLEDSSANDNNPCTELAHHGNTDSTVVMICVNVPVLLLFFIFFFF